MQDATRAGKAAFAAAVALWLTACGGADYDAQFTPGSAPRDYIPVTIERGALRADCRLSHFEVRIPPDAARGARAKPEGDRHHGWRLAVPRKRLRIVTVCDLTYGKGARFRYSTAIDATALDEVACAHERLDTESHHGVMLVCTNDDPASRTHGAVEP